MSKMPVVFVGHGSPMNAIEDNDYTRTWRMMVNHIGQVEAIIAVSGHWFTKGTKIMNDENPKTIYDTYGFSQELYEVVYNSPGSPSIAKDSMELISKQAEYDNSWGIDHGIWSVLVHMYPDRNIPLFQISVDAYSSPESHYKIGQELRSLREEGVLIFASGNIVHNLGMVNWDMEKKGYDWAYKFDNYIYDNIMNKNHNKILRYRELGDLARFAVPTTDHFDPLLYALGATDEDDEVRVYNRSCELGSLTMTSYIWN